MTASVEWLSTADAAKALGITPRTLYRFIDQGELAAYRFGRVIRIKQSDVDAFIEGARIEPGSLEHLYPDSGGKPEGAALDSEV
ncbi:MAG TPA: helix-turn-helix domain-containing protein [Acidimicrobiales bacterium]|nr:helix-turn-helix domain-containing protein [Acidimicrobiales bacterium]